MADYSRLKARHPNAKVRNIKRLIAEIRKMESYELVREKARIKPLKIGGRKVTGKMAKDSMGSVASLGKSRMPLVFCMGTWMDSVLRECGEESCGTAACIAGTAGALAARDFAGSKLENPDLQDDLQLVLERGDDLDQDRMQLHWTSVLSGFLGVDRVTSERLSSVGVIRGSAWDDWDGCNRVEPRHAVKLLEKFLETGKIDWLHAMGRNPKTRALTVREKAARKREEKEYENACLAEAA